MIGVIKYFESLLILQWEIIIHNYTYYIYYKDIDYTFMTVYMYM